MVTKAVVRVLADDVLCYDAVQAREDGLALTTSVATKVMLSVVMVASLSVVNLVVVIVASEIGCCQGSRGSGESRSWVEW